MSDTESLQNDKLITKYKEIQENLEKITLEFINETEGQKIETATKLQSLYRGKKARQETGELKDCKTKFEELENFDGEHGDFETKLDDLYKKCKSRIKKLNGKKLNGKKIRNRYVENKCNKATTLEEMEKITYRGIPCKNVAKVKYDKLEEEERKKKNEEEIRKIETEVEQKRKAKEDNAAKLEASINKAGTCQKKIGELLNIYNSIQKDDLDIHKDGENIYKMFQLIIEIYDSGTFDNLETPGEDSVCSIKQRKKNKGKLEPIIKLLKTIELFQDEKYVTDGDNTYKVIIKNSLQTNDMDKKIVYNVELKDIATKKTETIRLLDLKYDGNIYKEVNEEDLKNELEKVKNLREEKVKNLREEEAAVKIQSIIRGTKERKETAKLKEENYPDDFEDECSTKQDCDNNQDCVDNECVDNYSDDVFEEDTDENTKEVNDIKEDIKEENQLQELINTDYQPKKIKELEEKKKELKQELEEKEKKLKEKEEEISIQNLKIKEKKNSHDKEISQLRTKQLENLNKEKKKLEAEYKKNLAEHDNLNDKELENLKEKLKEAEVKDDNYEKILEENREEIKKKEEELKTANNEEKKELQKEREDLKKQSLDIEEKKKLEEEEKKKLEEEKKKLERKQIEILEEQSKIVEELKELKQEREKAEDRKALEKRKKIKEFMNHKGESLKESIEILKDKDGNFTNMSEIKIDALENYPTLHDKIKKFLVFKEDELIKAHHAKFYSDNIKRNNEKLVETLKLVPSEPFLGIEGLPLMSGFGSEVKEGEEEVIILKDVKEKVRKFIQDRAQYIFIPSQHKQLSVKEYLKNL
jgi:hypothetical protein